jgi:RNAse (barnase) inhibitor barstar
MGLDAVETLLEEARGGVYFMPGVPPARAVQAAAKRAGMAYFHIEGKNIERKEQLLNHVATALHFPKDFGHNWDALEECLTDMEWADADGYVIFYEHIDPLVAAHPDQFETFVEICRDAVASWKEDDKAMLVLLTGARPPKGVAKLKKGSED